jgi:hypothetical protein
MYLLQHMEIKMSELRIESIAHAFAGDVEITLEPAYQESCVLFAESWAEGSDEPVELYRRSYETREEGLIAFAKALLSEYGQEV